MQIKVSVCRKEGRPGYGSEGASCELTLDVAERTVSDSPASLVDEIRRAYSLAETAVSEQLARHPAAPAAAAPIEPQDLGWVHNAPAVPTAATNGLPSQARAPSAPEPDRQPRPGSYSPPPGPDGAARWQQNGRPRNGRELVPWSRKLEQSGQCPGVFKRLVQYGRSQNFPEMMTAWSQFEVDDALRAVVGEGFDDEPAAAPVGRNGNGYHNGNGNGR
jgi:hypothetical protein